MADLKTVEILLLHRIRSMDPDGKGVTKSEATGGLSERTAARRWQTMERLTDGGYLYRTSPSIGPGRYHLTSQGVRVLEQAFTAWI
jgi:hypothetical protein